MNITSHSVNPNTGPSTPNPFQRFYRGRAFDIVCGVIPALLLGIYSLIISGISFYSALTERALGGLFLLLLALLLLALSTFGAAACIALIVSTFARARLSPAWRTVCTVFLALGMLVALISLVILVVISRSQPSDILWLLIPLALGVSLSLAAFKQIRLLSGGDSAVLRR